MNRINKINSYSGVFTRLMSSVVILASLLILPKTQATIGSTFTKDQLKYTVYTEDKAAKTGTVSVEAESKEISGDIVIPESVENNEYTYSVTILPKEAFQGCTNLKNVTIPDSVTSIGGCAFANCSSLTSIIIPDSVITIEYETFNGCSSLTNVLIPNSVTSIGNNAFSGCSSLTNVVIPNGVTSLERETFSWCSSLMSITIPDSVTSIDSHVFYYCNSLTSIIIPDSVISIGFYAFYYCCGLTSITIPNSVTYIGDNAFYGCSNLTSVYFEGNSPSIDGIPFSAPSVIYYRSGTTEWTNPWCGRPATLWIEAPQIEEQPKSQAVLEGDSVTFTVKAEGTAPLNYQWFKDETIIEGAIGETYTIENVTVEDFGNYKVVVTNTEGEAESDVAVLSLLQPPTFIVNPVSVTVDNGTNVVFTVEALNADSYQWYKDGTAISGATETTYSIDYVKGYDVGTYTAMAINRAGAEKSSPAALSLTQPYRATAELQMVNGFIVGVTVTDCGWGYEFEPKVRIKDVFGEGAEAHCVVENGIVTAIILDNPGSGYSEETTVKVGSPFKYNSMEIAVKDVLITMHLTLGEEYQLECSRDLKTWEKVGEPFIAEDEMVEILVDVIETGRYFRVHEVK